MHNATTVSLPLPMQCCCSCYNFWEGFSLPFSTAYSLLRDSFQQIPWRPQEELAMSSRPETRSSSPSPPNTTLPSGGQHSRKRDRLVVGKGLLTRHCSFAMAFTTLEDRTTSNMLEVVVCQARNAEYNCRLTIFTWSADSNLCFLDENTLFIYLCLFGYLVCLPIHYRGVLTNTFSQNGLLLQLNYFFLTFQIYYRLILFPYFMLQTTYE